MAVHGNGLPIALISSLAQHAYMSQKAWSLCSASLLMTQKPAEISTGRSRGEFEGCAEADGLADLLAQPGAGPKEKTPEGISVGFVNEEGEVFVQVV
jgi:hypothetical protein